MSRVLVTGHLGYLGHFVVNQLLYQKHDVVGLDVGLYSACRFSGFSDDVSISKEIETISCDIRDIEQIDLSGYDYCIHLAGLSNDPLGNLDPELTFEINHRAAVKLAKACKMAGVKRLVAASSCSVYGASDNSILDEQSEFAPITAYAKSKLLLEQDISKLADETFSPVFLRGGTVYGSSPFIRFDLVVNNLVAWAESTGEILLKSDGAAWRPFVHVRDFAFVFCEMLNADKKLVHNQAFNVVAQDENLQVKEVASLIAQRMPGTKIVIEGRDGADSRSYRVSDQKLVSVLGENWNKLNLTVGIEELSAAMKKTALSPNEFEGPGFQRLEHLKLHISSGKLTSELSWANCN